MLFSILAKRKHGFWGHAPCNGEFNVLAPKPILRDFSPCGPWETLYSRDHKENPTTGVNKKYP